MVHKILTTAAALGLLAAGAAHAETAPQPQERRIVRFDGGVSWAERFEIVERLGVKVVKPLRIVDALVVEVPRDSVSQNAVVGRLAAQPGVLQVEIDVYQKLIETQPASLQAIPLPSLDSIMRRVRTAEEPPAEEPAPEPAPQEVPWGIARVNAAAAWPKGTGAGVKVAVVDTGIKPDHEDLPEVLGGFNAIDAALPWHDDQGHGTHVAGTIAAQDNGLGVVGVAPGVDLFAVKVLDARGSGYWSDIVEGIQWCVDNGIRIMNMSLGGSRAPDSLGDAIKVAAESGTLLIAAAGNSYGAVGYPAAYPDAIAISASDVNDALARFSSRGPEVEFIAPGVDVLSSTMDGKYAKYSGTSMASPHMAGLAALAVTHCGAKDLASLRACLKAAATPIEGMPPEHQGSGLVDAGKL